MEVSDLVLGSRQMAYRHVAIINLYLRTKFHSNHMTSNNLLWTDGCTDGWQTGCIWSTQSRR